VRHKDKCQVASLNLRYRMQDTGQVQLTEFLEARTEINNDGMNTLIRD
jgi:hypothetical protein